MVQRTQLNEAISRNGGKPTDLTIRRNGQEMPHRGHSAARGDRGIDRHLISEPTKSFKPARWTR
jgi:hypothetical protein